MFHRHDPCIPALITLICISRADLETSSAVKVRQNKISIQQRVSGEILKDPLTKGISLFINAQGSVSESWFIEKKT